MKKSLAIIVGIIVIVGVIYFTQKKEVAVVTPEPSPVVVAPKTIQLCFYKEEKTKSNLYDVSWVRMDLAGDKVTGEFNYLPAEKDKKVGTFEGSVSAVDKVAMARTADVWWSSMAEGMQVKEQLKIVFGEGDAQAGFGEMVDRGDGVYVYKDATKLTYGVHMTDVACSDIPAKLGAIKK